VKNLLLAEYYVEAARSADMREEFRLREAARFKEEAAWCVGGPISDDFEQQRAIVDCDDEILLWLTQAADLEQQAANDRRLACRYRRQADRIVRSVWRVGAFGTRRPVRQQRRSRVQLGSRRRTRPTRAGPARPSNDPDLPAVAAAPVGGLA
jgi:hypothetical protein